MYNPFNTSVTVGIDITDKRISALQLRRRAKQYHIEKIGIQWLPENVFAQGQIQHWDDFNLALAELVQSLALEGKPIAIALATELVQFQQVKLPKDLPAVGFEREIETYIQEQLNLVEVFAFDFVIQPEALADIGVYVAMAAKKYVSPYVEAVESSGLTVRVVDIACYALLRAVEALMTKAITNEQVILYIREPVAILVTFMQGRMAYYQTWFVSSGIKFAEDCLQQLQQLRKVLPAVNEVLLCCSESIKHKLYETIEQTKFQLTEVPAISFPAHLKTSAAGRGDFFIAYGLALRSCPRW